MLHAGMVAVVQDIAVQVRNMDRAVVWLVVRPGREPCLLAVDLHCLKTA